MTVAYNPFLVGKMLDRAGHPGTPVEEALNALRKAYEHSSSRGKTFSDIAQFVNGDIFVDAANMRHADLLNEIAELTVARDDDQARVRAQDKEIGHLLTARDQNVLTIDALRAEIAVMGEKLAKHSDVPPVEPVQALVGGNMPLANDPAIEIAPAAVLAEIVDDLDHEAASEPSKAEPIDVSAQFEETPPDDFDTTARVTWSEYARFEKLISLGRARSSIARTLSREFGERFSIGCVAEMMRQRWLSPAYLRLIGVGALTA